MSGSNRPFNDAGRQWQDRAAQMFEMANEMLARGMGAWLSMMNQGNGGDAGPNPFSAMMDAYASMSPRGAASPGDLNEGLAGMQAASEQVVDMAPAMGQAWMVAVASAVRYWQALAEVNAAYQGALMQAVADRASGQAAVPPSECRVLADELRAYLREIGDAAMLEARRLQAELQAVGEQIAQTTDAATPAESGIDPVARRYRAKP